MLFRSDAVVDEKRGPVFVATLRFERVVMEVDGVAVRLSPGVNVTGEIRTGERRVIEFLLSPIQTTVSQALGER